MAPTPERTTRSRKRKLYQALDFAMVRSPLLPIESYLEFSRATPTRLRQAATDPNVRRALATSSPSLLESLDRTQSDHKEELPLLSKLRRFLIRMSTRPTPFGTFAGVALAGWGQHTNLLLARPPRTRTRVDMDWLVRYVLSLEAQPSICNQLRWVANSAIWARGNRVVLSEPPPHSVHPAANTSIAATRLVRRALELARSPIPYRALLAELLAFSHAATIEKADALLQQLWHQGVLTTELMPPLTVEQPILWVRSRLDTIIGGKALLIQLDGLQRALAACDAAPVERVPAAQRKAIAHATYWPNPRPRRHSKLIWRSELTGAASPPLLLMRQRVLRKYCSG